MESVFALNEGVFGLLHCVGMYIFPALVSFMAVGLQADLHYRPDGEIGRHTGLKIRRPKGCAGSTPARGTIQERRLRSNPKRLFSFRFEKLARLYKSIVPLFCTRRDLPSCPNLSSERAHVNSERA